MKSIKTLLVLGLILIALPVLAATVPPTIPHPGINPDNGFKIGVVNRAPQGLLWNAPYLLVTPYQPNSGWLDGDRLGYHCAWMFHAHNGLIDGRVTWRAIPNANNNPNGAYIQINDTYMEEGVRHFDGSLGRTTTFADCPQDVGVEYEVGNFPDERPVVVFWEGDTAMEIRDYRTIDPAPGITFDVVEEIREPFQITTSTGTHTVNDRISVLARLDGVPVAIVYYDGLGAGSMFPTDEPEPSVECNAIASMSQGAQVYSGDQAGSNNTAASELEALTGDEWMLIFKGGATLRSWDTVAEWNSAGERHRCGTNAEIDNVLFIFDPKLSSFPADLNEAIAIMESRYPNAEIRVSLLVGAVNHVICKTSAGQNVSASQTHAQYIGLMTMPEAGPDLDVPCSGYSDRIGHLNNSGASNAQGQVAAFYNGG